MNAPTIQPGEQIRLITYAVKFSDGTEAIGSLRFRLDDPIGFQRNSDANHHNAARNAARKLGIDQLAVVATVTALRERLVEAK